MVLNLGNLHNNAVELPLHTLAYNLVNSLRTPALLKEEEHWSLTTLREKLIKIGAMVVRFMQSYTSIARSHLENIYKNGSGVFIAFDFGAPSIDV